MLGTDGSICDALNLESSDKLRSDGNLVGAGKKYQQDGRSLHKHSFFPLPLRRNFKVVTHL